MPISHNFLNIFSPFYIDHMTSQTLAITHECQTCGHICIILLKPLVSIVFHYYFYIGTLRKVFPVLQGLFTLLPMTKNPANQSVMPLEPLGEA